MGEPIRKGDRDQEVESPQDSLRQVAGDTDDVGGAGQPIQDPVLKLLPLGPDSEPAIDDLMKAGQNAESAAGSPPAGRTVIEDARRQGPLGLLQVLGPGLVTGASDDDPSGIGTYSQVGAQFGYGMLWMALFSFPLMAAVQELCARIALQTGVGLGIALRRKFPTQLVGVCILALLVANTINAGADIGALATGASMLTRGAVAEIWLVVPVAVLLLALQMFASYATIFKIFKWLTLALFAYVFTGIVSHPDLRAVFVSTVIPHLALRADFITAMVAVLGTTISPYLFFWQASAEVEEMRAAGMLTEAERRGVKHSELKAARMDIVIGMLFSNLVMYFIILTTATVLHSHGKTDIQTATDAASALAPFLGQWAFLAFALGLIGTGLLAIPILTGSSAYAVKEFLGLKGTLSTKALYRPTFYGIIALATLVGAAMNFAHVDPIKALFYTAVLNGVVAPPLLILIVLLGSDRQVMGDRVSGRLSKVLTWIAAGAMTVAACALIYFLVPGLPH